MEVPRQRQVRNKHSYTDRKYYCFDNKDFYQLFIHGDSSKNETTVDIAYLPCFRDEGCPDDWKKQIDYSDFEFNLISRKYDIADPNEPLKYHYESILVPFSNEGLLQTFVNVVRNDYKINDWYSFFVGAETKSFYSFEKEETYFKSNNERKCLCYF